MPYYMPSKQYKQRNENNNGPKICWLNDEPKPLPYHLHKNLSTINNSNKRYWSLGSLRKIRKSIVSPRSWRNWRLSDMLASTVPKRICLCCPKSWAEIDSRIIKSCNFAILIYITYKLHLPGPGDIDSKAPKRLELPIFGQPELWYLPTKYFPSLLNYPIVR